VRSHQPRRLFGLSNSVYHIINTSTTKLGPAFPPCSGASRGWWNTRGQPSLCRAGPSFSTPDVCQWHLASVKSLCALGQPEKALGHEPQIDPWLTHRTTAGLPSFTTDWRRSRPEDRATKMENKINQAVRGTPAPSVFHARRGWKSSNLSPLPVEGGMFSLTFPLIDQAFRCAALPCLAF